MENIKEIKEFCEKYNLTLNQFYIFTFYILFIDFYVKY